MNILICLDHNYVMPYGIMLFSLCANNRDVDIHLYVITDQSFNQEDKKTLEDIVVTYNKNNSIDVFYVTDDMIQEMIAFENKCYPRQTFYRLLMSNILPPSIDKILYLDGDIIIRKSLKDLWNIDLEGKAIGAVPDALSGILEYYNRLHYSSTLGYENAGVLLVNLKYWRENNLERQFVEFMKSHKSWIVLNDQDVLNYVTKEIKVHIPLKYNVQTMFLYKRKYMNFSIYQYANELDEAQTDPAILHFAGCGPWKENCPHPYKEEFFKYKAQTIWKDVPLSKVHVSIKDKMKEFLRKVLTPFGICHFVADYFDRDLKLISHNN
jgi:lipopolysaccharide biosynthesis glycosyltransferase